MSDHPTPDDAGQWSSRPPRPLDEWFDPFDAGPWGLIPITGGWSGGRIRFPSSGGLDVAFHGLTEDQARRLWRAAQRIGILTRALPDVDVRTQPHIRQLYLCYRRAYDQGRPASHRECAEGAGSSEAASIKRLGRAGTNWTALTEWWDKLHTEMSQWDKTDPDLSQ